MGVCMIDSDRRSAYANHDIPRRGGGVQLHAQKYAVQEGSRVNDGRRCSASPRDDSCRGVLLQPVLFDLDRRHLHPDLQLQSFGVQGPDTEDVPESQSAVSRRGLCLHLTRLPLRKGREHNYSSPKQGKFNSNIK